MSRPSSSPIRASIVYGDDSGSNSNRGGRGGGGGGDGDDDDDDVYSRTKSAILSRILNPDRTTVEVLGTRTYSTIPSNFLKPKQQDGGFSKTSEALLDEVLTARKELKGSEERLKAALNVSETKQSRLQTLEKDFSTLQQTYQKSAELLEKEQLRYARADGELFTMRQHAIQLEEQVKQLTSKLLQASEDLEKEKQRSHSLSQNVTAQSLIQSGLSEQLGDAKKRVVQLESQLQEENSRGRNGLLSDEKTDSMADIHVRRPLEQAAMAAWARVEELEQQLKNGKSDDITLGSLINDALQNIQATMKLTGHADSKGASMLLQKMQSLVELIETRQYSSTAAQIAKKAEMSTRDALILQLEESLIVAATSEIQNQLSSVSTSFEKQLQLEETCAKQQQKISHLERSLQDSMNQSKSLSDLPQEEYARIFSENVSLKSENSALKAAKEQQWISSQETIMHLRTQLTAAQQRIDHLDVQLASVNRERIETTTVRDNLHQIEVRTDGLLKELELERKLHADVVAKREEERIQYEGVARQLHAKTEKLTVEHETLVNEIKGWKAMVEQEAAKKREAESRNLEYLEKIQMFQQTEMQLNALTLQFNAERENLHSELQNVMTSKADAETALLQGLSAVKDSSNSKISELEAEISRLQAEISRLQAANQALNDEIERTKLETQSAVEMISAKSDEMEQLTQSLAEMSQRHSKAIEALKELQSSCDKLEAETLQMQRELTIVTEERDSALSLLATVSKSPPPPPKRPNENNQQQQYLAYPEPATPTTPIRAANSIGIVLSSSSSSSLPCVVLVKVLPQSPAAVFGDQILTPGDIIVKINGVSVSNLTQANQELQNPGSVVSLTVQKQKRRSEDHNNILEIALAASASDTFVSQGSENWRILGLMWHWSGQGVGCVAKPDLQNGNAVISGVVFPGNLSKEAFRPAVGNVIASVGGENVKGNFARAIEKIYSHNQGFSLVTFEGEERDDVGLYLKQTTAKLHAAQNLAMLLP